MDLALLVMAVVDCLLIDEFAVRNLPKPAWVFMILLFSPIGPIAWFVTNRPHRDSCPATPPRRGDVQPGGSGIAVRRRRIGTAAAGRADARWTAAVS
jgi:Phospholipase_D-nuclease N-terminal